MIFAIPVVLVGSIAFLSWVLAKTAPKDSRRKLFLEGMVGRLCTALPLGFGLLITSAHSALWARSAATGAWLMLVVSCCVGGAGPASRVLQVVRICAAAAVFGFLLLDHVLTNGLHGAFGLIRDAGIVLAGVAVLGGLFWIGDLAERRMGVGAHEARKT